MYVKDEQNERQVIPDSCRELFICFGSPGTPRLWPHREVEVAGLSRLTTGYSIQRMKFVNHVVLIVTKGELTYTDAREGTVKVGPGKMIFMPSLWKCQYSVEKKCSIVWMHLNQDSPFWHDVPQDSSFIRATRNASRIPVLMEMLYEECSMPEANLGITQQLLCQLLLQYVHDDIQTAYTRTEIRNRLEECFRKVSNNPGRLWSTAILGRLCSMSRPAFFAAVREHYGKPPMSLVRQMRLNAAAQMLVNTDMPLDAIAMQTGFNCGFSLSRAFKAHFGQSPGAWRRTHKIKKNF